jgi:hypothetical protein
MSTVTIITGQPIILTVANVTAGSLTLTNAAGAIVYGPTAATMGVNTSSVTTASWATGLAIGTYSAAVTLTVNGVVDSGSFTLTIQASAGLDARTTAVLAEVAVRVQKATTDIDSTVFAAEYAFAQAEIAARFPCTASSTLSIADMTFYDRSAALIVAARLYSPLVTGGPDGTVLSQRTAQGSAETYSPPDTDSPRRWIEEAIESLYRISCIQSALAIVAASYSVCQLSGRRHGGFPFFGQNTPTGAGYAGLKTTYPFAYGWGMGLLNYGVYPIGGYGYGGFGYGW